MPVVTRRQHVMASTADSPRTSTDSDSSAKEHIWVVEEDYEKPQKEMDFPSAKLGGKMPRHELRINTYSKSELHDRYLSSEEEPSPSPSSNYDSDSVQSEEELKHKSSSNKLFADNDEQPLDLSTVESFGVAGEVAVAIPIVACGRPKLVDITNLAPMQKRRRTIKPPVAPSSALTKNGVVTRTIPPVTDENTPFVVNEAEESVVLAAKQVTFTEKPVMKTIRERRNESQISISSAPESWLPEEELSPLVDNDHYFPDADLQPERYNPYTLEQPVARLSRSNVVVIPNRLSRRRNNSNPFNAVSTPTLKGLSRTLSLAKKHGQPLPPPPQQQSPRQLTKKSKMIARGANERAETPVIPPFPFEGSEIAVA